MATYKDGRRVFGPIEEFSTEELATDQVLQPVGDGSLVWNTLTGGVSEITDLPTSETNTTLRLAPDGVGGVEWAITAGGAGGGIAFEFEFDTTTTDSDPGSGKFRYDNATQGSATFIYINYAADNSAQIDELFKRLDADDRIYLRLPATAAKYHLVKVTGRVTDGTTYVKIPISSEDIGTSLANADTVGLSFEYCSETPSTEYQDQLAQSSDPAWEPGREWWDGANSIFWSYVTDQKDQTIGTLPRQLHNNTGTIIPAGKAVSFDDIHISTEAGPIAGVVLTDATDESSVNSFLAVTKYALAADTDPGDEGMGLENGLIAPIDTSMWSVGDILYVDPDTPGDLTNIPPASPAWQVRVGFVAISDANGAAGIVTDIGNNTEKLDEFFVGGSLDTIAVDVSSDGATVTCAIEKSGGGDIDFVFSDGFYTFDSTPAASVNLTAGSDTSPTRNYVYLLGSTKLLTASTVGWPATGEYAPIADVIVQSAASVQTKQVYKNHVWTDHVRGTSNNGHLQHLNEWVRRQHATWLSGCVATLTVTDLATDTATFGMTSGVVQQLHEHATPAFADPSDVYVYNHPTTSNLLTTDIATVTVDSNNATLLNRHYSLIYWGVVSEETDECKVFVNLPSGSYASATTAAQDNSGYTNFDVPSEYKGTGYLIARYNVQLNAAGTTFTLNSEVDLRGKIPGTTAGGSGGAGATQFSDNEFAVFNVTDNTKILDVDVSAVTTATTRTASVPDKDGILYDAQDIQTEPVDATSPSKNDVLMYDGSQYTPVPEGTTFTFTIATFTDSQTTTWEIGTGAWKAIGALSFTATYNNGPATAGDVSMTGFGNSWAGDLDMGVGTDYEGPTVSTEVTNYPSSPGTAYFTLTATDGVDPDTLNDVHYFWNNRHWGVNTVTTGITETQIEALAGSELSNSRAKTFTVTAAAGEYIWYCYPTRLGTATFTVGGFEGGFESPETVSVTNPSGYVENYYAYRSTNSGLGSTTVVVS